MGEESGHLVMVMMMKRGLYYDDNVDNDDNVVRVPNPLPRFHKQVRRRTCLMVMMSMTLMLMMLVVVMMMRWRIIIINYVDVEGDIHDESRHLLPTSVLLPRAAPLLAGSP